MLGLFGDVWSPHCCEEGKLVSAADAILRFSERGTAAVHSRMPPLQYYRLEAPAIINSMNTPSHTKHSFLGCKTFLDRVVAVSRHLTTNAFWCGLNKYTTYLWWQHLPNSRKNNRKRDVVNYRLNRIDSFSLVRPNFVMKLSDPSDLMKNVHASQEHPSVLANQRVDSWR